MKMLWCWRRKAEVPMLEPDEFREVMAPLQQRQEGGPLEPAIRKVIEKFNQITGERLPVAVSSLSHIQHSVTSRFGPPCKTCSKPLRTPEAKVCAYCGTARLG